MLTPGIGDTIFTSAPIPMRGERIDPAGTAKPRVVPLQGRPKVVPAHVNVHPVGTPELTPIPTQLPLIVPGENGVLLPKTVPAQGKVVTARHPQPVSALLPRLNKVATADFQYLDLEQGMNSNSVFTILEDRRGNLWFATDQGISRYDGDTFYHYREEEGLRSPYCYTLLEDRHGNIWFGTGDRGITRYDGNTFTHFSTGEGLIYDSVIALAEDRQGNLWIGTAGGLCRYDGKNFTHFTEKEGLSNDYITAIYEDQQGILWFGTREGGVSRYDGTGFTHFTEEEGLSSNFVWTIAEDREGKLWFGTWANGVNRYDGKFFAHYTTEQGLGSNSVTVVRKSADGDLWFGSSEGTVTYFDGRTFVHYGEREGLSGQYIYAIVEDRSGNIWFGTWGSGAIRYNPESFAHYTDRDGLSGNDIQSIFEDSRGHIWFGTRFKGVSRFDGKNFTHFTLESGLAGTDAFIAGAFFVNSITEDRHGNIWFGTNSGASCYREGSGFTHFTTTQGLSSNNVNAILEDRRGYLWFGTSRGLCRYDGESFTSFTTDGGLCHRSVTRILEDSRGHLWFGTAECISRYAGNNLVHFAQKAGQRSTFPVFSEDKHGNIWLGARSGLISRYDGTEIFHYRLENDWQDGHLRGIATDGWGRLWFSSNGGIGLLKLLLAEHASFGLDLPAYQLFTFGLSDGLKELTFSLNNAICLDQQNRIWWGTINGATMLDLQNFELAAEAPEGMQLTDIRIKDQFINYQQLTDHSYLPPIADGHRLRHAFDSIVPFYNYPAALVLPHDLNHLTFHFSAIDWAAPHQLRYSYTMEGLDKQWSPPRSDSEADYRNLPYGTFTFKVKAIGAAQIWSEPVAYTFTVLPPWWHSWWAYTLYVLAISSLLYIFYDFQLRRKLAAAETHRLRELNQVKTKLYTNITHEFRTPLTVIQGLTDRIESEAEAKKEKNIQSNARIVRRNSSQLLTLVNQMLDLSKLESGNLPVKLVQGNVLLYLKYLLESFHSLAETKDIRLHFLSRDQEVMMDYDPEKLRHIVSNLLSNAIKFTPAGGEVYVTVDSGRPTVDGTRLPAREAAELACLAGVSRASRQAGNPAPDARHAAPSGLTEGAEFLQIAVKDTGIGIAADKLPHIFDRFYQVDDEATRKAEGTGIGLTLTRELVRLLEGEIQVESQAGAGSTFQVWLPIRQTAPLVEGLPAPAPGAGLLPPSLAEERPAAPDRKAGSMQLPLVLLIEDNRDVAHYIHSCLEGNYRIAVAYNGREGIDKALELVPDLIISDVMMPEKDGFEVTQTLKSDERTSHIPIVLLTAKADITSKLEGLERGADAYLPKPFHKGELLLRLRKLLELRRQLRQYYLGLAGGEEKPTPATETPVIEETEDLFIRKVRAVVEAHLEDADFSVADLCRETALSHSQFHRKITALTGYSAVRFIRYIRLAKAKELLANTTLNISEVAYQTGFQDPVYFTRVFRAELGVTPTAFREGDEERGRLGGLVTG